jgi:hypothetical protein
MVRVFIGLPREMLEYLEKKRKQLGLATIQDVIRWIVAKEKERDQRGPQNTE